MVYLVQGMAVSYELMFDDSSSIRWVQMRVMTKDLSLVGLTTMQLRIFHNNHLCVVEHNLQSLPSSNTQFRGEGKDMSAKEKEIMYSAVSDLQRNSQIV